MPGKEDNKDIEIYEDEIREKPSLGEDGYPLLDGEDNHLLVDKEDILEGIDLGKDIEDIGSSGTKDERFKEKQGNHTEAYDTLESSLVSVNNPEDVLQVSIKPGSPLQRNIEDPTENDDLYISLKENASTSTILNNIMVEIAEEAAYLKTWRKENYNLKDDLSEISNKRILILKKLVETVEKREKISNSKATGRVDFHSDNFQKVFEHFLQTVKSTFEKVNIPTQYEEIFFSQLAKDLDGFEDIAEKIYHGKKVKK